MSRIGSGSGCPAAPPLPACRCRPPHNRLPHCAACAASLAKASQYPGSSILTAQQEQSQQACLTLPQMMALCLTWSIMLWLTPLCCALLKVCAYAAHLEQQHLPHRAQRFAARGGATGHRGWLLCALRGRCGIRPGRAWHGLRPLLPAHRQGGKIIGFWEEKKRS